MPLNESSSQPGPENQQATEFSQVPQIIEPTAPNNNPDVNTAPPRTTTDTIDLIAPPLFVSTQYNIASSLATPTNPSYPYSREGAQSLYTAQVLHAEQLASVQGRKARDLLTEFAFALADYHALDEDTLNKIKIAVGHQCLEILLNTPQQEQMLRQRIRMEKERLEKQGKSQDEIELHLANMGFNTLALRYPTFCGAEDDTRTPLLNHLLDERHYQEKQRGIRTSTTSQKKAEIPTAKKGPQPVLMTRRTFLKLATGTLAVGAVGSALESQEPNPNAEASRLFHQAVLTPKINDLIAQRVIEMERARKNIESADIQPSERAMPTDWILRLKRDEIYTKEVYIPLYKRVGESLQTLWSSGIIDTPISSINSSCPKGLVRGSIGLIRKEMRHHNCSTVDDLFSYYGLPNSGNADFSYFLAFLLEKDRRALLVRPTVQTRQSNLALQPGTSENLDVEIIDNSAFLANARKPPFEPLDPMPEDIPQNTRTSHYHKTGGNSLGSFLGLAGIISVLAYKRQDLLPVIRGRTRQLTKQVEELRDSANDLYTKALSPSRRTVVKGLAVALGSFLSGKIIGKLIRSGTENFLQTGLRIGVQAAANATESSAIGSWEDPKTFEERVGYMLDQLGHIGALSDKPILKIYAADKKTLLETIHPWVAIDDVPPELVEALQQLEDREFQRHYGVNPKSLTAAIWGQVSGTSDRGGSTLTMQVVKWLSQKDPFANRTAEVRNAEKVTELRLACVLERTLFVQEAMRRNLDPDNLKDNQYKEIRQQVKKSIIELYLNCIPWGPGNIHGLANGAKYYFGTESTKLKDLTPEQILFLAHVPWSPVEITLESLDSSARNYVNKVYQVLAGRQDLPSSLRDLLKKVNSNNLRLDRTDPKTAYKDFLDYLHYVTDLDKIPKPANGRVVDIVSSFDQRYATEMERLIREQKSEIAWSTGLPLQDISLRAFVRTSDGRVAYVFGNMLEEQPPGSTLKPLFLQASMAIARRTSFAFSGRTPIIDGPANIKIKSPRGVDTWQIRNTDPSSKTKVVRRTVADALLNSSNSFVATVISLAPIKFLLGQVEKITSPNSVLSDSTSYPSLLGNMVFSLPALATHFAALGHKEGITTQSMPITEIAGKKRMGKPRRFTFKDPANEVASILQRVESDGSFFASPLRKPLIGKTGTDEASGTGTYACTTSPSIKGPSITIILQAYSLGHNAIIEGKQLRGLALKIADLSHY